MDVIEGVRLLHYYTRGSIAVLLPDDRAVAPVDTPWRTGRWEDTVLAYVDAGTQAAVSCRTASDFDRVASRMGFRHPLPVDSR